MNRRSFLLLDRQQPALTPETAVEEQGSVIAQTLEARSVAPPGSGLNPYTGPWTAVEVRHLLRRTMFGFTQQDVAYFLTRTPQQAVQELLNAPFTPPEAPVNDYVDANLSDPNSALGQPYIGVPNVPYNQTILNRRVFSMRGWWLRQVLNSGRSIREKMTLCLHNYTAVRFQDTLRDPDLLHEHATKLRNRWALGNYKTFIKELTLDSSMLIHLNGALNTVTAPDENYGREIQELFVIGKDLPQHYTEDDVKAAARLLTGWRTDRKRVWFDPALHDTTDKRFSAFYGNRVIRGRTGATAGEQELDEFLDMLFAHPEAAKFTARKLYRFFVYHKISPTVETNVIEPLAQVLRANNYELKPVMDTLLRSEHFFDPLNRGAMIKSPVDMVASMMTSLGIVVPPATQLSNRYNATLTINGSLDRMKQHLGDPITVAGWPAYYEQPTFDKLWVNNLTLSLRALLIDSMILFPTGLPAGTTSVRMNVLAWARTLSNPGNPNILIREVCDLLLGLPVSEAVRDSIKASTLLSGQSDDSYWVEAWDNWIKNPTNTITTSVVDTRLRRCMSAILQLEEFQLQ
jgi:uncharacterized protein (DUF1800 family)